MMVPFQGLGKWVSEVVIDGLPMVLRRDKQGDEPTALVGSQRLTAEKSREVGVFLSGRTALDLRRCLNRFGSAPNRSPPKKARDGRAMTWIDTAPLILIPDAKRTARRPYPLSWSEQRRMFALLPKTIAQMALFKQRLPRTGGVSIALGVANGPEVAQNSRKPAAKEKAGQCCHT